MVLSDEIFVVTFKPKEESESYGHSSFSSLDVGRKKVSRVCVYVVKRSDEFCL